MPWAAGLRDDVRSGYQYTGSVRKDQAHGGVGRSLRMSPTVIDLFAGAGGMTEGFRLAGFTPILAVEIDVDAAATYRANLGDHVIAKPIESVRSDRVPQGGRDYRWTTMPRVLSPWSNERQRHERQFERPLA